MIRLEAGPAYQAQVLQRLIAINQSLSEHGFVTEAYVPRMPFWKRAWKNILARIHLETTTNKAADRYDSDEALLELQNLLLGLKTSTEEFLQHTIQNATITTPRFLPQEHEADIKLALSKVSLNISSCGEIEDSLVASTLATRFFQQSASSRETNISTTEWLLGPFRMEEVMIAIYTDSFFALSVFELYTGKSTWTHEKFRYFFAPGEVLNDAGATPEVGDLRPRNLVAGMRKIANLPSGAINRTLRLVLQGPSVTRPRVLSIIQSAFETLLPSQSQPYAVRIAANEEEMQVDWERIRLERRSSLSRIGNTEDIFLVKDYERDLLRSINVSHIAAVVEPEFSASRGAVVMGLHFLDLSCEERQQAGKWSWDRDNQRPSTRFYPDPEVEPDWPNSAVEEDAPLREL